MYDVLLTHRYLTSRVIPLIAVAAVAMCVALVIIVVSVMTGFLDMVKDSGRTLIGDVVVAHPLVGLPYYERLIDRIEALPEAAAATPVVEGFGLLKMPYPVGDQKQTEMVQVWGIDAATIGEVTGFGKTLYWRPEAEGETFAEPDFRAELEETIGADLLGDLQSRGQRMASSDDDDAAMVMGMHVSIANERQKDGSYRPVFGPMGYWWMPRFEVALTMVPIGSGGSMLEPDTKVFRVVNEFVSGVFMIDDKRVMIPIRRAQRMLNLDEAQLVDDEGEPTGFADPARATMVLVRAVDGVTPDVLRDRVEDVFEEFRSALMDDETVAAETLPPPAGLGVQIQTWRQQQRQFIDPVEKERELMRVLFSIIYLVCAGLVLSIFWAIVYEKTRDIGILRSIGASRIGISAIFLRYGAIIGVVGAALGLGLAYLVVRNINAIHTAMGEPAPVWAWAGAFALAGLSAVMVIQRSFSGFLLPVVLWGLFTFVFLGAGIGLKLHRGMLLWDPSVYYFSEIPSRLDPVTVVSTMIGAVVFSVLGAFIPAMKAADTDPVKALRYE